MSKPEISAWYHELAADLAKPGGLTKEDVAKLQKEWNDIIVNNEKLRENAAKITGVNLNNSTLNQPSTVSATIQKQITEDTGTELAGLMRKISDDNRQNRDYNKQTVEQLFLTVAELKNIDHIFRLNSFFLNLADNFNE